MIFEVYLAISAGGLLSNKGPSGPLYQTARTCRTVGPVTEGWGRLPRVQSASNQQG